MAKKRNRLPLSEYLKLADWKKEIDGRVYYSAVGICKTCGRLTRRRSVYGNCPRCGIENVKKNIRQLKEKKGEWYEKWRKNLLRAVEGSKENQT